METVMSNEAVAVPSPGSGYGSILMKLQGLQILGGEIWVSRIKFTGRDRHFTI